MHNRFKVQDVAEQAAACVIRAAGKFPALYRSLGDQALRAATSVPLNIAEARGRQGKDRAYHFRVAFGSAREVESALVLLAAIPSRKSAEIARARALFDEVRAMLWRILHPR